jgi:hypothetical protein
LKRGEAGDWQSRCGDRIDRRRCGCDVRNLCDGVVGEASGRGSEHRGTDHVVVGGVAGGHDDAGHVVAAHVLLRPAPTLPEPHDPRLAPHLVSIQRVDRGSCHVNEHLSRRRQRSVDLGLAK